MPITGVPTIPLTPPRPLTTASSGICAASFGRRSRNDLLLRWRSVLDNILLPIEILYRDRKTYAASARDFIRLVNLERFEESFGQRSRNDFSRAALTDAGPESFVV